MRGDLARQAAEGDAAARRAARQQVRVAGVKVAAGAVARHVQALDCLALRVYSIHIGVNSDAVQRADEVAEPCLIRMCYHHIQYP